MTKIHGGAGDDVMYGDALVMTSINNGDNEIEKPIGGADTFWGDGGHDTFVFAPGCYSDSIMDFSQVAGNRDLIDVRAFNFSSIEDMQFVSINDTDLIIVLDSTDANDIIYLPGGGQLTSPWQILSCKIRQRRVKQNSPGHPPDFARRSGGCFQKKNPPA